MKYEIRHYIVDDQYKVVFWDVLQGPDQWLEAEILEDEKSLYAEIVEYARTPKHRADSDPPFTSFLSNPLQHRRKAYSASLETLAVSLVDLYKERNIK